MSKWYTVIDDDDSPIVESIDELIEQHSIPDVLGALLCVLDSHANDLGYMDTCGLASEQLAIKLRSVLDDDSDFPEEQ